MAVAYPSPPLPSCIPSRHSVITISLTARPRDIRSRYVATGHPPRRPTSPAAVWVVVLRAMQRAGSVRPPWAAGAGRSVDGRTCCRFALLHCNVYRNRIESKSRFFAKIESKSIENRNNHIVTSLEKIAIFDFDYRHRPSLPVYNFCPLHLPCLHSLAHPPIALYSARL